MTDTSKDAVERLVLFRVRNGKTTVANMLTTIAVERDAANARADAAEYRIVHIAAGLFPGGFDNNVAAIQDALRDKPAPGVTVQEAKKALMFESIDSVSKACKLFGLSEPHFRAALRAIAGGGDE